MGQQGAALPGRAGWRREGRGLGGNACPVFGEGGGKGECDREVRAGRGCLGRGEGQVPSLRVFLASLACPVLPEGRNRNDEKMTQGPGASALEAWQARMSLRVADLEAGDSCPAQDEL